MGLFRKSPAEKKLKELTGGIILSTNFINRLKENGIEIKQGVKIQNQLKDEISGGSVDENNLEDRLTQLVNEYADGSISLNSTNANTPNDGIKGSTSIKKCPQCGKTQDANNNACIYCGHKFYSGTKKCPICYESQDDNNAYCINCGYDFNTKQINVTQKECPNCHKKIYITIEKCNNCGYDFQTKNMPDLTKTCPACRLVQKGENKLCRNCKEDLQQVDYNPSVNLKRCPDCGRKIPKESEMCPFCKYDFIRQKSLKTLKNKVKSKKEKKRKMLENYDSISRIAFLSNYDFNIKTCPECGEKLLKVDPFCFNCGETVVTQETVKNDNLEVKDGKLVSKENNEESSSKLSDLEALYSQTVKSKYVPSFKIAYVLFLENFKKNPNKKFSDKTAKKYETTPNKLKKQALEDEFIELAPAINEAKSFKVTELKEILKQHNLKVSGKKDELIERLDENLSEDELKKYFKSKNYQISDKGLEFIDKNAPILYIYNDNSDVSRVFYPSEIFKIFEEKQYDETEIYDILIDYLKKVLDEKLTQELWVDFKSYANAISQVQEDKGDLRDALDMRFKVFLFDINNFSIVLGKPDPRQCKLKKKDVYKLNNLLHNLTLPIDELKELFEKSYNEVLFKTVISSQDSLIYLLKVFGGEDLDGISSEIREKYSSPY